MIVIGLSGGIASGKSYVARLLAEKGARILDADKHAQQVLDEPHVIEQLVERWGSTVRGDDGNIIRGEIARKVFGDQPEAKRDREFLEALVHPLVRRRLQAELDEAAKQGMLAAVLDIPLLHESGWAEACDWVLFVETSDNIRQRRAAERGWQPGELAQREGAQLPLAKKKELANATVSGDSKEEARERINQIWEQWVAIP